MARRNADYERHLAAFTSSCTRGVLSSTALIACRESIYDEVLSLGKQALKEAQEVQEVAEELGGDPTRSTRYLQATRLADLLQEVKTLMDNNYTFTTSARDGTT